MELSLEAYRNIVKYVGNRADIAALCRVSKGFRYGAERALYNTLYMRNAHEAITICSTLASRGRLAMHVDALTIILSEQEENSESEDEDEDEDEGVSELSRTYWSSVARALEQTKNLRYLNIHISNGFTTSSAWILNATTFLLRRFHCDLDWDENLVAFLNRQINLDDLYIIDYNELQKPDTPTPDSPNPAPISLESHSLPNLATLECTFMEAALVTLPGRPITHLKTCFSRSEINDKRAEVSSLLSKIKLSTRSLRALDIADSSYTEAFSMELLASIVNTKATNTDLRYLGTLVLPISGRERLQFYGLLMRLPRIQCVEVEVSEWLPPPTSPPAFRALASEMRLYNPSVTRVIFVHDFDRTVVTTVDGVCRMDNDIGTDFLWREI